jgi:XTP/dITP diphosphohydrolase
MLDRLLIATTNPGKKREYAALLGELGIALTWPDAEGIQLDVEESGASYAENARIKATAYAQASGLWALADDSGLDVDALDGAPGVRSARFGGPGLDDAGRYRLLLDKLKDTPDEQRAARFRCVIALVSPTGRVYQSEGACEGVIARAPRGDHGFGYDPVFYMPELRRTMAELPEADKNRLSHRARAAVGMIEILRELAAD